MRYVCLLAVMLMISTATVLSAQAEPQPDGAAIYKERCASCHDMPEGRVPALSAIKAMSGEAIYIALTSGAMKTQAQGLSIAQIFTLLGYIAPTGGAAADLSDHANLQDDAGSAAADFKAAMNAPRWNGWSTNVHQLAISGRAQRRSHGGEGAGLKLKWAFNLGAVTMARSQPVIVGGRVFIGSLTDVVYSLDAETGCTYWGFKADAAVRGGVTLGDANGAPAVFFGDASATVYALNAQTGELIWKIRPVDHFTTMITAAPQVHNGVVYQAFSSFEEVIAADPELSVLLVSRKRRRAGCRDRKENLADVHDS